MAQELSIQLVCSEIDKAFREDKFDRVEALLWPALNQFSDMPQLWFFAGNLCFNTDRVALAVQCFQKCWELDENPNVLANLGASYRRLNAHEEGIAVLKAAIDRRPDYAPALVNLGSMYVNEGCPNEGIPYLERACVVNAAERGARWNLGLLYLEAGRFAEGFDIYRTAVGAERQVRSYGGKSDIVDPPMLKPEDNGEGKTLIVYGEQGIGDELMFATCLEDARNEFKEVIFECHPRLEQLHRWAQGEGMRIYPTRKEEQIAWPIKDNVQADFKCPIADLAARYRKNLQSFSRSLKPPYTCDSREVLRYREQLKQLAEGRPIIGLATRGGVMQTARQYRTLKIADADYLFSNTDCLFVALDYDDMTGFTTYIEDKYGPGRYRWSPSIVQHWDYHHTAALCAATDMVVAVCQSVAHLSGGMGLNTRVLTPYRCAWRYANVCETPEQWYWYPYENVKLYREDEPDVGWKPALDRVINDIKQLSERQR